MKLAWIFVALLSAWPAAAAAAAAEPWREASSDHFVVLAQYPEDELRTYALQLERFDKALRVLRKLPDAPIGKANRVTVAVLGDTRAVGRLADAPASGIAGFYHGRAGASLAITSREQARHWADLTPQLTLLHEYTHHFMLRHFPAAYPTWFLEGFAEFYATTRFLPDGGVEVGAPANHRAEELALIHKPNLAAMLADRAWTVEDVYGFGWLLTHYLTFSAERRGQLGAYLDAINRGTSARDAATKAFGPTGPLERELLVYRAHGRMKVARLSAAELPVGRVAVRTLSPAEAAMVPVALRVALAEPDKPDRDLAGDARRAAAAWPTDPDALATLAEADMAGGRVDDAAAAAERLLETDPRSQRALIVKASAALARAAAAVGAERVRQAHLARDSARAANRVDPDHPVPLILFYRSFAAAGETPTANAAAGLTAAHLLAPEDGDVRLLLARQKIADRDAAAARDLLQPLAYDLHAGKRRAAAAALLATLPPARTD